jgi:hypothetical protein
MTTSGFWSLCEAATWLAWGEACLNTDSRFHRSDADTTAVDAAWTELRDAAAEGRVILKGARLFEGSIESIPADWFLGARPPIGLWLFDVLKADDRGEIREWHHIRVRRAEVEKMRVAPDRPARPAPSAPERKPCGGGMQIEDLPEWFTPLEAVAWITSRSFEVVGYAAPDRQNHTYCLAGKLPTEARNRTEIVVPTRMSLLWLDINAACLPGGMSTENAISRLVAALRNGKVRSRGTWENTGERRIVDSDFWAGLTFNAPERQEWRLVPCSATNPVRPLENLHWRDVRVSRDDVLNIWRPCVQESEIVIPPDSSAGQDVVFLGLDTAVTRIMTRLECGLGNAEAILLKAFRSGDLPSRWCGNGVGWATANDPPIPAHEWSQGRFSVERYRENERTGQRRSGEVVFGPRHHSLSVVAMRADDFRYWLDKTAPVAPASVRVRSAASSVEVGLGPTPTSIQANRTRGTEIVRSGFAGRPTSMHLVKQELERRRQARETQSTQAKEAAHLSEWLSKEHPGMPPATAKAISNGLRDELRAAKTDVHPERKPEIPPEII